MRNRRPARAAAARERDVAQRPECSRTTRGGARSAGSADAGHTIDRAARQPVDADVEEAADDRAERRRRTAARQRVASWMAAPRPLRLVGQREERRRRATGCTRPVRRRARTACRCGSSGMPGSTPRARRARSQSAAACPVLAVARVDAPAGAVDLVERVELQQAALGVARAASRSRPTARIDSHMSRDERAVAALGERRRGQRAQPPRRARHSLACLNQSAACR